MIYTRYNRGLCARGHLQAAIHMQAFAGSHTYKSYHSWLLSCYPGQCVPPKELQHSQNSLCYLCGIGYAQSALHKLVVIFPKLKVIKEPSYLVEFEDETASVVEASHIDRQQPEIGSSCSKSKIFCCCDCLW